MQQQQNISTSTDQVPQSRSQFCIPKGRSAFHRIVLHSRGLFRISQDSPAFHMVVQSSKGFYRVMHAFHKMSSVPELHWFFLFQRLFYPALHRNRIFLTPQDMSAVDRVLLQSTELPCIPYSFAIHRTVLHSTCQSFKPQERIILHSPKQFSISQDGLAFYIAL